MNQVKVIKPFQGYAVGDIIPMSNASAKLGLQFKSAERISDEDAKKLTDALAKADADAAKAKAAALAGANPASTPKGK